MAAEANDIAKEVQAFIVFRVRLVGDLDDNSEESKPSQGAASSASTPKPEPSSSSRKRNSIRHKQGAQTATAVEDVLDRKLREGIITDAEWRVMKAANRSAAEEMSKAEALAGGQGDAALGGGGDSDDSNAEDEAVSADMENVLQSAVSAERMDVVVQCFCEVPRHMVRRATGRVLGWGSGPSLVMTSARWPSFAPLHAHFAPPASALPKPSSRKLSSTATTSATASATAANTSANAGGVISVAVATNEEGSSGAATLKEATDPPGSQGKPKKKSGGVSFAEDLGESSSVKHSNASSTRAGASSAPGAPVESGTQSSSSSSSSSENDKNGSLLEGGGAPNETPEAALDALRSSLMNDVGNAIKIIKNSEVLLSDLAEEVKKLPVFAGLHQGVLAKQVFSKRNI